MKKKFQIVISLLCLLFLSGSAFAVRGRPHVDSSLGYNVLLSDQNTLLRGVSLSWDGGDPYGSLPKVMPSMDSLIALREVYGLNTIHLFLEGDSDGNTDPAGTNAADCDILVDMCAQADLYLIITIGCNGQNGQIVDLQFCVDFWNFYAPRYKDETHVIYEAKNEPVAYTCGHWTEADWDKQVVLYNAMRPNAPDTLLLMFTFQGLNNAGAAINGIDYLASNGVDWNNVGVAWHGYTALDAIEDVLDVFSASTDYPVTLCTEFWPGDTEGQYYNSAFESYFTGWMQFQWLSANDSDLTSFAYKIDTAGTVWTPEVATCNWPVMGTPNIPSSGSNVGIFDRGVDMFISANGDLRANLATYTGSQNDKFIVEQVASSIESNMVALKAPNGLYVSTTSQTDSLTAESASVGNAEKFIWFERPNGEVVLRSFGGQGHLITTVPGGRYSGLILPNADNASDETTDYAFVDGNSPSGPPPEPEPEPEPEPGPFYGTPMIIPGVIEAEDFDYGGEGVAYHDTDPENLGGAYRPEEGVDIEACSEGGSDVGWMDTGEWMNYTVDVAAAGDYIITVREAGGNGTFHIEFDGVDKTGTIPTYETGGWQVWVDINVPVTLSAGVQVMTFYGGTGFNLNKLTITEDSIPVCGDATCDPGEDQCNCSADCGTPPSTETTCDDGVDEDCDGNTDCDDTDCDGDPACPDCAAVDEYCETDADCCSLNCFERKNYCKS